MSLVELVRRLVATEWTWRRRQISDGIEGFAGRPIEEVPGRITYQLPGDGTLSVYGEGEEVFFVEATLEVFLDPDRLSAVEYEDKVDEFFQKYEKAVSEVRELLGPPVFDDGAAASGFPEDQEAEWLALWPVTNGRLMIQQKHEDRESPLRLCVVVAPPVVGS